MLPFIVVVQLLCWIQLFATPWTAAHQASLSFTISQNLFKFISIESEMPSNHFALCCSLPLLPSIFPSIGVFSNQLALQVAKVLELQLQQQSFQWIFKVEFLWDWHVSLHHHKVCFFPKILLFTFSGSRYVYRPLRGISFPMRSLWWTGKPGVLRLTGKQRVRHDWVTELTN